VNASLITGLTNPLSVAVGSKLIVGATAQLLNTTVRAQTIWVFKTADPRGLAVSGSDLFDTDTQNGTFTKLDAFTGQMFFTVAILRAPTGIAVSRLDVFVASATGGIISEYDAPTAVLVNASLVSGLNQPVSLAVLESDLFVVNSSSGSIGEYTTSGSPVNASLITGLTKPEYLAVTATTVPEPGSLALLRVVLAGLPDVDAPRFIDPRLSSS
jgi:hypothetical protein